MPEPNYCSKCNTCTLKYGIEKQVDLFPDDPGFVAGRDALRNNQCYQGGNVGTYKQYPGLR